MMRKTIFALLIGGATMMTVPDAAAQATTEVQLRSFLAPVNPANPRANKEQPITIVLTVADSDSAFYVCELVPRLRDALLETLYYNPIPISAQNVMDASRVEPLLLQAANRALRRQMVSSLQVKLGAEQLVTGSSRSRASALGCGEVENGNKNNTNKN